MPPIFGTPQPRDEIQAPLYPNGVVTADEYVIDPGVCVLPVAEDPPLSDSALADWSPVEVFALHAPFRVRRAMGRATKQNNPPVVPAPADSGAFAFIGGTVGIAANLSADLANFNWNVVTSYTFVEDCVSRVGDGFVLSTAPWTWQTQQINQAQVGGAPTPPVGSAVSLAGLDAKVGYGLGQAINLNSSWGYNTPTFFPGTLFSVDLINGGPPSDDIASVLAAVITGG